ncbi:tyrosine-type recombinase/integrase [Halioxenophilus sp. WMMB6]|uniref:tyrosine-type recombinase/integrase n=1 Tax=Halioxenophilus sp. WMMB6 TaxID=3073815 RepID=UPI00295EC4F7|nr:tyrosine-type recombinase/integrase [Halioxenophilus sp. WMMB6]
MAGNKLTDIAVKQAEIKDKDHWLNDGQGLRLLVKANGTKAWRYGYRFNGKQKTLAIGTYPEVTLKAAREIHQKARFQLQEGIDPAEQKQSSRRQKRQNQSTTFSVLAREWWEHQKGTWKPDHANRVILRLEQNAFPTIGDKPIADVRPQDVIRIVRHTENRGAPDVAQRVLEDIRRVCRYSVQMGKLETNPASELDGILKGRKTTHRASLPREELPEFLKLLSNYHKQGRLLTQLAIELLVLTFVRPGELRGARWEEFDFEQAVWRVPGERMKMGTDHLVPLCRQALEVLERVKEISGSYELLFPSERKRNEAMSENTMRRAIFKLGYDGNQPGKTKANPHGFRATASSILNEAGFNPDAIERQLAHMERNGVRAAYIHHARYLDDRVNMMAWWADYLDELRDTGKVIPLFGHRNK